MGPSTGSRKAGESGDAAVIVAELFAELKPPEAELARFDSDRLVAEAIRWGVPIAESHMIWEPDPLLHHRILSAEVMTTLQRANGAERRTTIKWWVEVITQVAMAVAI